MRHITLIGMTLCALATASSAYSKDCFIAYKNNKLIQAEGECDKRYPPCSTFKIAISLMGFDHGILIDETHPTWDFKPGYVDWLEGWKQPHTPKLWLPNSCVWYSQVITENLGEMKFSEYLSRFEYGNQDISGDKGMNNGLTNCWLSSSLAISPREQIYFLNKLVTNTLPVSLDAQVKTKNIMYQDVFPGGWELYGKTGNGYQVGPDGNKMKEKQVGWFIGFVRKEEAIITFVQLIADDFKKESYASLRAKDTLKRNIEKIIYGNSNMQKLLGK